jgi:hypothetical protein
MIPTRRYILSSLAFIATITVLALIRIASAAGLRSTPQMQRLPSLGFHIVILAPIYTQAIDPC